MDKALSHALDSVNGTKFIQTPIVDDGFYWFVVACSGAHNDTTTRVMTISIEGTAAWHLATSAAAVAATVILPVLRGFIVPTHQRLRLETNLIAAGSHVELRVLYFKIRLGFPAVPSP